MTFAACSSELIQCDARRPVEGVAPRAGLLRRIYDAVLESRQKQAERVAVAFLERTGGRFTDDIERRLTDRLIHGSWRR